jgi:hypothetical protein
MRVIRLLTTAVLGGGVLLLPGAAVAAAEPSHVGIVIGSQYACVRWHSGITGDDVLNQAAAVTYRSDGIVLTINGEPNPPHADDTHFWSYWHDTGGRWHYSGVGASAYQPKAGTVEGWSYDNGHADAPQPAAKPATLYAGICGARDKPEPKPTRSHTHHPVAPTTHVTPANPPRTSAPAPTTTTHAPVTATTATSRTTRPAKSAPGHSTGKSRPAPATRRHSTAAARPAPSTETTHPALRPAAQSLRPLPRPTDAAASDGGSPVRLLIGVGAAVVIGAGGVWTAIRRRRAD